MYPYHISLFIYIHIYIILLISTDFKYFMMDLSIFIIFSQLLSISLSLFNSIKCLSKYI